MRVLPAESARGVMFGAHQVLDGFVGFPFRIEKQVADSAKRRFASFIEPVEDERLERLRAGARPVVRESAAVGVQQQLHDVLHVAHLVRCAQPHLGERVETCQPRFG